MTDVVPDHACPSLYTRNTGRETEMFGPCPLCGSRQAKTVSGKPGSRFLIVCPKGHDREVEYERETGWWRPATKE